METLVATLRNAMNNDTILNSNTESIKPSTVNDGRDFRQIRMPETKIGLGSNEADLIVMIKKYLEIVGLVFFVWLLGE